MATFAPIHPGEVLLEEFLAPMDVSQHRLSVAVGVPPRRINEIVHGKRRITANTALRLARYFGTTDHFWLNLQTRFDLEVEKGPPRFQSRGHPPPPVSLTATRFRPPGVGRDHGRGGPHVDEHPPACRLHPVRTGARPFAVV